ncbi:single-stranded DNA-binding protein [Nocardia vinacea]|uniref:single-stranded DNA-binding protein n=1 Tax=Nocardia vinacea TaxID=96468 RepID=UPI003F4E444C
MAGDTVITVIGNLTADVELKFTPGGVAVANFTVASTPRHLDRATNQWKDSEALFLRCSLWREAAENAAECLIMWISKIKSAVYQQFYDVDMSISSTSGAVAIPAH